MLIKSAALLICIIFLILHIKVQPFNGDNDYQFMAMISVLLALFIGIVLRANQQMKKTMCTAT